MSAVEILNLRKAFDERQSTAIAQFFDANAASKRDIEEVRLEIEEVRLEIEKVRAEVEKFRSEAGVRFGETNTEIQQFRSETDVRFAEVHTEFAKVRGEIEKTKAELTRTILQVQIGGVLSIGLMIGLLRVFT